MGSTGTTVDNNDGTEGLVDNNDGTEGLVDIMGLEWQGN